MSTSVTPMRQFLVPAVLSVAGLLFFAPQALPAQDSLSVTQVIRAVLLHHPLVARAAADMRAQEARIAETRSARYPSFGAEATYVRIGPVPELSFPGLGLFRLAPENNYDAHIGGRMTVYDFGKTSAAVSVDEARLQSSRDGIDVVRTNLAAQTVRTFYSIALLQKSLQINGDQLQTLAEHLDVTRKRVDAGTATEFDILTTQARIAAAENQTADVENALARQQSVLRQLLGVTTDSAIAIRGEATITPITLNADSLYTTALLARPEVRIARDAEQVARERQTLVGRGDLPSILVNANFGIKNGYIPNLDALHGNWVAGIRAEIPAFNPRQGPQEEEAKAAVSAEEAQRADVERQVRADVEQAIAEVQSAQKKMEISRVQLQQTHDAAAIARTRYETGSVTNLDLLDAETNESAARLALLQAQYRYVLSTFELHRATGSLLAGIAQ